MMKLSRLFLLLSLLTGSLFAQTTAVTGNLKTVLAENLSRNAYVQFRLENTGGAVPRVSGTGAVAQLSKRVNPDSNGLFSTTVYSNASIIPAGTYYCLDFVSDNTRRTACYTLSGTSVDINTATPLTTPTVLASPATIIRSFNFTQASANTTWTITHSFGDINVVCQFFNGSNQEITPTTFTRTDLNTVTATWGSPQAGFATCLNTSNMALTNAANAVVTDPNANQAIAGGFNLSVDGDFTAPRISKFRFADQFVGATDTIKVQACVNDLPNATHDGVCIVPATMNPTMASITLGADTLVINYSTAQNNSIPSYWGGSGDAEFQLNAGGNGAPALTLNDFLTTGAASRSAAIVFRSGGVTAQTPGGLRNVWQLASGQGGANNDDLNLWGWQGTVYSTGTVSVTNNSTAVVGSGTTWTAAMIGANFLDSTQSVAGTVYDVTDTTHLTLAEAFSGATQGGDSYTLTGGSSGTQQSILIVGQNGAVLWNRRAVTSGAAAAADHIYYQFGMPGISTGSDATMLVQRYATTSQNTVADQAYIADATNRSWGLDRLTNEFRVWPAFALGSTPGTASFRLDNSGNGAFAGKLAVGQAAPNATGYADIQAVDNSNVLLGRRTGGNITHNASIDGSGNGALTVNDSTGTAQVTLNGQSGVYSIFKGGVNTKRLKAAQATSLVAGDFALSAGWGNTASVGSLRGVDQNHEFVVTSAGTGQGASPTITLTYKDGTWTTAPIVMCNRQEFASQPTVTFTVTTQSATQYVLTFNGTPVAAETYRLACHVGGI